MTTGTVTQPRSREGHSSAPLAQELRPLLLEAVLHYFRTVSPSKILEISTAFDGRSAGKCSLLISVRVARGRAEENESTLYSLTLDVKEVQC